MAITLNGGAAGSVTATSTTTFTGKTIALGSNTISGTLSQLNTAITDADIASLAGAETLTNKTLTTPIISSISNTGTLTLPTSSTTLIGTNTTDTLTNKTLTSPVINYGIVKSPEERLTVSATAATGTVNFDTLTQGVLYYTTNASANWTLNVRGDGSTTLNDSLTTGDSITIVFLVTQGATAYYSNAFTIDGSSVTPKYISGTAFSAGNASSIDSYVYTIIKTGSATFTVLASQTKFA